MTKNSKNAIQHLFCNQPLDKASAYNAGDLGSIPGSERSLEKEMATHSGILAWRIPWAEEPGRLQSMGSQRVRHNLATERQQSLVFGKI